jgi:NAD dependent epimerase/dehydratase family enzyme
VPLDAGPIAQPVHAAEAAAARFTAAGRVGVVLRFGLFVAADSDHTRAAVAMARRRLSAQLGRADGYHPTLDPDDGAAAVVAALGAPAGTYLVVDDEPLTRAEQDRVLARAVGRRRLWRVPDVMVRRSRMGRTFDRSVRASNRRFREDDRLGAGEPELAGHPRACRVRRVGRSGRPAAIVTAPQHQPAPIV